MENENFEVRLPKKKKNTESETCPFSDPNHKYIPSGFLGTNGRINERHHISFL